MSQSVPPRPSPLARYGPIAAVFAVAIAILVVAVTGGDSDPEPTSTGAEADRSPDSGPRGGDDARDGGGNSGGADEGGDDGGDIGAGGADHETSRETGSEAPDPSGDLMALVAGLVEDPIVASIVVEYIEQVPAQLREALDDEALVAIIVDALPSEDELLAAGPEGGAGLIEANITRALSLENLPPQAAVALLPEGVVTFDVAQATGQDIDFGHRCDLSTGQLALPVPNPALCMAPFEGDNGGATATGVTADAIRIVYWTPASNDVVLSFLTEEIQSDDTTSEIEATLRGLLEYYEAYYETYGRNVELIVMEGSGLITDPVSARNDAVRIAEEYKPFMVWGGPSLTTAFAEELAARDIPCLGCGPGQPSEFYARNDPLLWSVLMGPEQLNFMVAEYVGKRLARRPASHAGDPELATQTRRFGRLYVSTDDTSDELHEQFVRELDAHGVSLAAEVGYSIELGTIQVTAANAIARLKEADVTTVLLSGDPRVPQTLTREASAQGYFPEWIITGTLLTDTNVYGRSYDQQQWAHAFGITPYTAKVTRDAAGAYFLYRWFHGEPPPAEGNVALLDQYPVLFYPVLAYLGPNLSVDGFRDALFLAPATPTAITSTSVSFGNKGRWPLDYEPDYFGIDDVVELWWDPAAEGEDELGDFGTGMYRYVDGGTRYLPGEFPETPPNVFDPVGTSVVYTERPPAEPVTDYQPVGAAR